MVSRTSVQTVSVPLSGTISGAFSLKHSTHVAVLAPVVTSGTIHFQVGFTDSNPSSADFVRAWTDAGTGAFVWNVAAGSAGIVLDSILAPYPVARIECQNAQAAARIFTVITKT